MAVIWPAYETNNLPTGDQALHLVANYGEGAGEWDGTEGGISDADWYVVDGLGDQSDDDSAGTTPHAIFGREQSISTPDAPSSSITLNGWYAHGDTGQGMIRTAKTAKTNIGYLNIRNRALGYGSARLVRVGGGSSSQNAQGGLQPVSYTLAPQADPIDVADFDTDES